MLCFLYIHSWIKRPATLNPKRMVRRCKSCGRISVVANKIKPAETTSKTSVAPVDVACMAPQMQPAHID